MVFGSIWGRGNEKERWVGIKTKRAEKIDP
jgi:hypothetical protein